MPSFSHSVRFCSLNMWYRERQINACRYCTENFFLTPLALFCSICFQKCIFCWSAMGLNIYWSSINIFTTGYFFNFKNLRKINKHAIAVSICTRILKYRVWKIEFDELGFLSISNSNFAGYTGSKNIVQTRQKFQFINFDFSNSIFQNPSPDRYRESEACFIYILDSSNSSSFILI